ncbi:hypothetical protein BDN71DRAFT_1594644 [Pleurotus eryngii]|uniref:F-box domain-containing protein n=1 Tax=Pleurotus eryngii TaxID=5323 RepID=A0A9P6D8S7_PLEER|nr:hypothetical protein BDN71DRAFT_1594644 [Pleurotus eryngii]
MSTLSELPPELLHLTALYLRTVDCSNLSLTCWMIYNAVAPVLFESIRIFDEFSGDISQLFDECPLVKSATRHITLFQWDSDFIAATLSADIATFLNLTSLCLLLNNAPHLCWMQQLHRLFLNLRNHRINKLKLELTDFIDPGCGHLSSTFKDGNT